LECLEERDGLLQLLRRRAILNRHSGSGRLGIFLCHYKSAGCYLNMDLRRVFSRPHLFSELNELFCLKANHCGMSDLICAYDLNP
jgi:hypothetical protein